MDPSNAPPSPLFIHPEPAPTPPPPEPAPAPDATPLPEPAPPTAPEAVIEPSPTPAPEPALAAPPPSPPPPPPHPPALSLPDLRVALRAWASDVPLPLRLRTPAADEALRQAHAAQCEAVAQALMEQAARAQGQWDLAALQARWVGLGDEAWAQLQRALAQPAWAGWAVSAGDEGSAVARAAWQRCLQLAHELLKLPGSTRLVDGRIAQAEDELLLTLASTVWRGDAALVLGVPVPEQVPVPEVIGLVCRVSSLVVRWGQEPERPAALRAVRVRWSLTPVQAANPVWPRRLAQVGHRVLAARLAELQARLPALRDAARAASGNPAGDDGYDALVGRLQRLSSAVVVQPGDATVDEGPWVLDLSGLPASPLLAAFRGAWEALGGQWGEGLPEALGGVGAVSIGVAWPAPVPAGASGA